MKFRSHQTESRLKALRDVLTTQGPSDSQELAKGLGLTRGPYSRLFGRELRYVLNDFVRSQLLLCGKDAHCGNVYALPGQREALTRVVQRRVDAVAKTSPAYGVVDNVTPLDEGVPGTIFKQSATATPAAMLTAKTSLSTKVMELTMRARAANSENLSLVAEVLERLVGEGPSDLAPAAPEPEIPENADEVEVALAALVHALNRPKAVAVDVQALLARCEAQAAQIEALQERAKNFDQVVQSLRRDLGKVENLRKRMKELL